MHRYGAKSAKTKREKVTYARVGDEEGDGWCARWGGGSGPWRSRGGADDGVVVVVAAPTPDDDDEDKALRSGVDVELMVVCRGSWNWICVWLEDSDCDLGDGGAWTWPYVGGLVDCRSRLR